MNGAMLVNAEDFWMLMCDPAFIRMSPLSGHLRNDVYVTLEAPEGIPGFIDQKIAGVKAIFVH